jgi:CheY-like chemotaxis protein
MLKLKNIELEHSKKEAEESSQLKTQFISNVTHELRTPLYGVVGLSALLLNSKDLSKKDYRYIKSIKYSADYLLELVNNVLQMGKMESETIALKSIPTNLSTMLKDIVSTFEKRLQETNNTLVTKVDKAIPNMLDFDKVRLTQILVNLIGNSIKFTENGTIHLRVKQLNSDDNKVKLNFEVEDNGTGISKKNQKRIFQNFTQLVDKNNNKYQGTGLGLPIAQNLVELFGGSIEVKSELGKGASFSFTIDVEKSNVIEQINHPHPQYLTLNGNYKVLVAEDNKINQIVTRNLLEEENFECHVVNNGAEALAEFKNNTFDLILMDINMPIMGGNEATTKIRAINPNIPIIALTAADIEEVEKDYQSIGYNDVITKPFDNHSFFQKVIERIQESKIKQNYEAFNKAKKLHISS